MATTHYFGWRIDRASLFSAISHKNSGALTVPLPFKVVQYKRRMFIIMICDINNVTSREYKIALDFAKKYACAHVRPRFYEMKLPFL